MIKVLIVNDSIPIQQLIKRIIDANDGLKLVGIANDGNEAVSQVKSKKPDVVLMDIYMPHCDGVQATKIIMAQSPRPILIVTGSFKSDMSHIFECLNNGALDVVRAPSLNGSLNSKNQGIDNLFLAGAELIEKIRIVAALKKNINKIQISRDHSKGVHQGVSMNRTIAQKIIVIGASTGGPKALLAVLNKLPKEIDAGILIVQHIAEEFGPGLAKWLDSLTREFLSIHSAKDGDKIQVGCGYLAVLHKDIILQNDFTLRYEDPAQGAVYTPNIDVTFESVAKSYGKNAIGVLLTGMGSDGAQGLKAIREAGGRTIAQDEESSLIYGMPHAAKKIGSAEFILSLEMIANQIVILLKQ